MAMFGPVVSDESFDVLSFKLLSPKLLKDEFCLVFGEKLGKKNV